MPSGLFPFADYWWFYLAFTGLVAVLLAVDLTLHRKAHVISFREALGWTSIWILLALAFNAGLYLFASSRFTAPIARQLTLEFLAGYIVEESLSVDNMFVFALVFRYFAVPSQYQHRVLFYGVLGAMFFRAIFIAIGSALIQFHWVMILFGLFLIFTGIRLAVEREKQIHPGDNPVVRLAHRLFPVTRELHGPKFFVHLDGVRHLTPLMIVLIALETTDIVFAIDSVPAVFGVTSEPLVVYTSNVFAILGLRSMYFLLAGAMDRFHALKYGLATVLVFVGLKMAWLDDVSGGRFPIDVSLAIISSVIVLSIVISVVYPKSQGEAPPRPASGMHRQAVGAVLLLLCAVDLFIAGGPASALLPPHALEQIHPAALFISAGCYAISGALLLFGERGADEIVAHGRGSRPRIRALHKLWLMRRQRHGRAR
jgi:tellurite resistance protein TerC